MKWRREWRRDIPDVIASQTKARKTQLISKSDSWLMVSQRTQIPVSWVNGLCLFDPNLPPYVECCRCYTLSLRFLVCPRDNYYSHESLTPNKKRNYGSLWAACTINLYGWFWVRPVCTNGFEYIYRNKLLFISITPICNYCLRFTSFNMVDSNMSAGVGQIFFQTKSVLG